MTHSAYLDVQLLIQNAAARKENDLMFYSSAQRDFSVCVWFSQALVFQQQQGWDNTADRVEILERM